MGFPHQNVLYEFIKNEMSFEFLKKNQANITYRSFFINLINLKF